MKKRMRIVNWGMLGIIAIIVMIGAGAQASTNILPAPKKADWTGGAVKMERVRIIVEGNALANEAAMLGEMLKQRGIDVNDTHQYAISLRIMPVSVPAFSSLYKDDITRQAYRLQVNDRGVNISGASAAAVFHGLQTFDQLFNEKGECLKVRISDWPDLPTRMLMIDPARQNENFDYYRRFIQFAARYKINAILCHMTDDQTSAMQHEKYPELMHPQAWTPEQIAELRQFAERHHIELIPEIESFGHSRMFTRREDFRDFLHQTKSDKPTMSWVGTDVAGFTNVLCPASPKARTYLGDMYERASKSFDHEWIHIGFDEVDVTDCDRCREAFGAQTPAQWIAKQLAQCRELVGRQGRKTALWGDMILKYPEVLNDLPTTSTVIFDWHYNHDVTGESSAMFKAKGYQVIACPSLVCAPHMIMPDWHNFENITSFTQIAKQQDLAGVCTTIWIPPRYMSDVLWPGIAFAAAHAWGGAAWDEAAFYNAFARDHWGSPNGADVMDIVKSAAAIEWHRGDFVTSCWIDAEAVAAAQKLAAEKKADVENHLKAIDSALEKIAKTKPTIAKNQIDWAVTEQSIRLLRYTMIHLQAAPKVKTDAGWNLELIRELDRDCAEAIKWIEADWARNRYPGDPNMDGLYLTNQHLLYQFRQMHKYHQEILGQAAAGSQSN